MNVTSDLGAGSYWMKGTVECMYIQLFFSTFFSTLLFCFFAAGLGGAALDFLVGVFGFSDVVFFFFVTVATFFVTFFFSGAFSAATAGSTYTFFFGIGSGLFRVVFFFLAFLLRLSWILRRFCLLLLLPIHATP